MNFLQKVEFKLKQAFGVTAKTAPLYNMFKYTKPDGSFDYERYRQVQIAGNAQKLFHVNADQNTINFIAEYRTQKLGKVSSGLCHGTRRGAEQQWFSEALGAAVMGTDIAPTATQFPNTVQWDFHDTNPDWVGKFDFVYTNSHDHAFDPEKAFNAWFDQLRPGGALIIEHSTKHLVIPRELDPFGFSPEVLPFLVLKWASGRFAVTEILEPDIVKTVVARPIVFVIRATPSAP